MGCWWPSAEVLNHQSPTGLPRRESKVFQTVTRILQTVVKSWRSPVEWKYQGFIKWIYKRLRFCVTSVLWSITVTSLSNPSGGIFTIHVFSASSSSNNNSCSLFCLMKQNSTLWRYRIIISCQNIQDVTQVNASACLTKVFHMVKVISDKDLCRTKTYAEK